MILIFTNNESYNPYVKFPFKATENNLRSAHLNAFLFPNH